MASRSGVCGPTLMANAETRFTIQRTKLLETNYKCEWSMNKVNREIKTKKIGELQKPSYINDIAKVRKETMIIKRGSL